MESKESKKGKESKESEKYRMWKEETLANQTSHREKKHPNEKVLVQEKDCNDYFVELAQGWR